MNGTIGRGWLGGGVAALIAAVALGIWIQPGFGGAEAREGVFVHISHGSDDAHRVAMGLQMASIMSETRDVLVYFDITGVEVVLKDGADISYSHFPSSREQIKALMGKGVHLCVCPGCLKAAGKTAEDVMEGVLIAGKDDFFTFTQGRILTLDY